MTSTLSKARHLPDELVAEILAPTLSISLERFNNTSNNSPFNAPDHLSTSVILVVCKQWLRVATPLLYNTVIIRTKLQAKSLDKALKSNPSLANFIKRLRLEDLYGKVFAHIVRISPGIKDLCLCFDVLPEESAQMNALTASLPLINPTTLNVNVTENPYRSQRRPHNWCCSDPSVLHDFETAINNGVRKWTNLVSIHYKLTQTMCSVNGCHSRLSTWHRDLALALGDARSIQSIHLKFELFPYLSHFLQPISKNTSIQMVNLQPEISTWRYVSFLDENDPLQRRLDSVIHVNGRSRQQILHEKTLPPAACALASSFSDYIWCRILEFTMDGAGSEELAFRAVRRFTKMCMKFQVIGIPYLYKHPVFTSMSNFAQFCSRIREASHLRSYVESIKFKDMIERRARYGLDSIAEPSREGIEAMMEEVFSLLPNLKEFSSDPSRSELNSTDLAWGAFDAIRRTSANSMIVFRPAVIVKPEKEKLVHVNVFAAFRNVTRLKWNSLAGFDMSDGGRDFPPDILSSLVELDYVHTAVRATRSKKSGPSLLAPMSHLDLPALRTLILSGDSCPEAVNFLERHGSKLTSLELDTQAMNPESLLENCSSLLTLTIRGDVLAQTKEYHSLLHDRSFDEDPLEKIVLLHTNRPRLGYGYDYDSDKDWQPKSHDPPRTAQEFRLWPRLLDPAVYRGYPALREIHVNWCHWPQTEEDMKANHWPKISAKLMTANIKLMDGVGRFWVPKMGDTTSKMRKK